MKGKIIYITVFGGSFVIITIFMILLNYKYKNIYAFDFSSVKSNQVPQTLIDHNNYKETFDQMLNEFKSQIMDSIRTVSYIKNDTGKIKKDDSVLTDSINVLKSRLEKSIAQDTVVKPELLAKVNVKSDSTYRTWTKKTASLYEAMDSKKAAKIIQNYSDNVARDILYSMKKKKAAEVLANLNPETANRMTRIQ